MYRWMLVLHIVAFISWMAGMLYIYRLFVYHAEETEKKVESRFEIMEFRLYRYITFPAMVVTFLAGLSMLWMNPGLLSQGWMHAKLTCVLGLTVFTFLADFYRKQLQRDPNAKSGKFFRFMNEGPTLLMIFIVIFVIIRPF